MNFLNKNIVVTGGTRGIGATLVEMFASEGANVITTGREESNLRKLKEQAPSNIGYIHLDMEDEDSINGFNEKLSLIGSIDVLVNNAGINRINRIENVPLSDFKAVMKVNVDGPFRISQMASKLMSRNGGRIVNVASIWSNITKEGRGSYSTSKAALVGLTRSLAIDYASSGILVNAVSPGFTATDLTYQSLSALEIAELERKIPSGRMAHTAEISELIMFLSSNKNTYITGQNFVIDGGYSIV
mgnify:CR=1 FL=1